MCNKTYIKFCHEKIQKRGYFNRKKKKKSV